VSEKQLSLFAQPTPARVRLKSSFEELLGKRRTDMPEKQRRARWKKWLALAQSKDPTVADTWLTVDGCVEKGRCRHLTGKDRWCRAMGLPASVNPILSFRHGIIGMACMGFGHAPKGGQENA